MAPPDYFVLGLADNLPVRTAWKEAEQTDGSRADLLSETFFSALKLIGMRARLSLKGKRPAESRSQDAWEKSLFAKDLGWR